VLIEAHPDLFPDAASKYSAMPRSSLSGRVLFNVNAPVNWIIADPRPLGDLPPLHVAPQFQDGFMDMPPYRAYPLELQRESNADVPILRWDGSQFVLERFPSS
jgi:hypothetical protein